MNHSEASTSQTNRALAATGNFAFIRVAENSKSGKWSTKDSENQWALAKNQSSQPFADHEHNQGIVPKNKGLILDVDVDKKASPEQQAASRDTSLTALRELFGSDIIDSTTINSTPGGGLHVYLELSCSPTASLTAGSLSKLDSRLHGELRIAGANAYVLTEGSVVDGRHYRTVQGNGGLSTLSRAGTDLLFTVFAKNADTADNSTSLIAEFEAGEHKRKGSVSRADFKLLEALMESGRANIIADIKAKKRESSPKFYFGLMGLLYEAMSHCYSLDAIAATAARLGIARTSDGGFPKTSRELTRGELRQELNWLKAEKPRSTPRQCHLCSRKPSDASNKASGAAGETLSANTPDDAHETVSEQVERMVRAQKDDYQQNTFSRFYAVTDQLELSLTLLAAAPRWARKQSVAKAKSSANADGSPKKKMKRAHRSHKKVYNATRYAYWIMVAWFDAHRQKGRRNIWGHVAGIQEAVEQHFGVKLSKTQVRDGISYLRVAKVLELVRGQAFHPETGGLSSVYRVKTSTKKFKSGPLKGKRVPKFVDAEATNHLLVGLYKGQDTHDGPVEFRELSLDGLSGHIRVGRIDESGIYSEGDVVHSWLDASVRYAEWLWSFGELLGTEAEKIYSADLRKHIGPIDGAELSEHWKVKVKEFLAAHPITGGGENDEAVTADDAEGVSITGADADDSAPAAESTTEGDVEMSIDTTEASTGNTADKHTDTNAGVEAHKQLSFPGGQAAAPSLAERLCASAAYRLTDDADVVDNETGEVMATNISDESFTDHAAEVMGTLVETTEDIANMTAIANGLTGAYKKVKENVGLSPKESELVVRVGFRHGVDVEDEFFTQEAYQSFLLMVLFRLKDQLGDLRDEQKDLLSMLAESQERREKEILKNEQSKRKKGLSSVSS